MNANVLIAGGLGGLTALAIEDLTHWPQLVIVAAAMLLGAILYRIMAT